MKPIKIAFFDIDGTLIDFGKNKISEKVTEALNRLKANGVKICIATGRPPQCIPHFDEIDFDAFLTFNSSYCFTGQHEVIYKNPIPQKDVHKIIENAREIGHPVSIATTTRMGANGCEPDLVEYYAMANQTVDIAEDFDTLKNEEIYQIMLACTKDEHAQILDGVEGARITAWWDRAGDIIPANGGKGVGVEKILEYYHFTKEEAMAFGDGANDLEMLEAVGLGVAMGNAKDNVKAAADDVCESVSEDGVYQYLKKTGLI